MIIFVEIARALNIARQVPHELQLGLNGMQVSILNHTFECVAHVRYEHIQHDNLREEGSQDEEKEAEVRIWLLRETLNVIEADGHEVLIKEKVDDPGVHTLLNYWIMIASVHIEHEKWYAEQHEANDKQDGKRSDVPQRL